MAHLEDVWKPLREADNPSWLDVRTREVMEHREGIGIEDLREQELPEGYNPDEVVGLQAPGETGLWEPSPISVGPTSEPLDPGPVEDPPGTIGTPVSYLNEDPEAEPVSAIETLPEPGGTVAGDLPGVAAGAGFGLIMLAAFLLAKK